MYSRLEQDEAEADAYVELGGSLDWFDTFDPDVYGRYTLPEVEMEIGLLDGWVRFWHQKQLLPLPSELQRDLHAANRRAKEAEANVAWPEPSRRNS